MTAPTCEFTPCGGEVDGVWQAREVCVEELHPNPEPGCENAFRHTAELEGTYTFFKASGHLLTDVTLTAIVLLDVDDGCATAIANGAATAAQACPLLQARYDEDASFDSAACEMQGALCHCELRQPASQQNVLIDYTTAGTTIDTQGDLVEYCVSGDELGLHFADSDFTQTFLLDRQ